MGRGLSIVVILACCFFLVGCKVASRTGKYQPVVGASASQSAVDTPVPGSNSIVSAGGISRGNGVMAIATVGPMGSKQTNSTVVPAGSGVLVISGVSGRVYK